MHVIVGDGRFRCTRETPPHLVQLSAPSLQTSQEDTALLLFVKAALNALPVPAA